MSGGLPGFVAVSELDSITDHVIDVNAVRSGTDNGLWPEQIPLTRFYGENSQQPLGITVTGGDAAIQISPSGETYIYGTEGASGFDAFQVEGILPQNYVAGQDITLVANAQFDGAGTNDGSEIQLGFYRMANNGEGEYINPTGSIDVTNTAADYSVVVDGTTLEPGDRYFINGYLVGATSSGTLFVRLNSLRIT